MDRREFLQKSACAMIPLAGSCLLGIHPALASALSHDSEKVDGVSRMTPSFHFEGFNERIQAYIVARYYARLTGVFGQQGREAFLLATRTYAEQRGHRMAQRAIADGKPLTVETYHEYGEWVPTEESIRKGESIENQVLWDEPYYTFRVKRCPWAIQFREMGMREAGLAYCKDLDASIYRGFNPHIDYETRQTLHDHDCCIQCAPGARMTAEAHSRPKRKSSLRPFEYHCAHSYWTFRQIVVSIFGDRGIALSDDVLNDVGRNLGDTYVAALKKYEKEDFDVAANV